MKKQYVKHGITKYWGSLFWKKWSKNEASINSMFKVDYGCVMFHVSTAGWSVYLIKSAISKLVFLGGLNFLDGIR